MMRVKIFAAGVDGDGDNVADEISSSGTSLRRGTREPFIFCNAACDEIIDDTNRHHQELLSSISFVLQL